MGGAISDRYRGWLELALIAKNAQLSLAAQNRDLQSWRDRWPGHTPSRFLPAEIANIEEMTVAGPEHVSLVLPLDGAFGASGRAIRDGFLAAYYQSLGDGEQVPSLRIVESESESEFLSLYRRLVADGSNLIIGPLDKRKVAELANESGLPVPTLALNYLENAARDSKALFQFGLSALDEARQLVRRARLEGGQNALILAPDSLWGREVASTLLSDWQDQGGTVLEAMFYTDQRHFRGQIADSLLIGASEQRAADLQRQIGRAIDFEPRRRRDLDLVFMVASPEAGRALKPLLAFYYAADVPVYATSHVFAGVADVARDRDLDGTRFVDIPWIASGTSPLKSSLERHPEFREGRYQRLYALGVDAFRLAPRLVQWQRNPAVRVFGESGSLLLNDANQIVREGEWLRFDGGRPVSDPLLDDLSYPKIDEQSPHGHGGPGWKSVSTKTVVQSDP